MKKEIRLSEDIAFTASYYCRMHGLDPAKGFLVQTDPSGRWVAVLEDDTEEEKPKKGKK
jgi:hypothetical protein